MDLEGGEINCSIAVEQLAPSGVTLKKVVHKNATVVLGRNEFKDVILRLNVAKRDMKFVLRDVQVHKKFVREGKATVKLLNLNMQLMFSNCPPDKLIMFLKTMTTKLECLRLNGFVSERKKLLSDCTRVFQEISPLNMKELQTVHQIRAKQMENKADLFTPKGKTGIKRKRENHLNKENIYPQNSKVQNKGLSGSLSINQVAAPVLLNAGQKRVLAAVLEGHNIFFTGSAGTGKSFLLRRIIGALAPQHTFATASTGVAACHIGGTTLHAFAGIGSGRGTLEQCVELASRTVVAQQWRKCKHLIVDEISMVDGDFFDKLETVARVIRKSDKPFGGIQLIMCGDFLQLPPVTKGKEKRRFAFQSKAWNDCIEKNFELTDVRRQSDKRFINILQHIRMGRCPTEVNGILTATSRHTIDRDGIMATRLCTHKEDVDHINDVQLNKLSGAPKIFEASDSDPGLVKTMNTLCPVRQRLELREGTQVMLTKNLDIQKGLVNGARGVVVGFENDTQGYPKVKFVCGVTSIVRSERWSFKVMGGVILTRRQLPLKLAWAISIHKSQGMSLDCVEMSLSRVFESGQAYVALSRARNLEGLRVLDFDSNCVRADPAVIKFYRQMQLASGWRQVALTEMQGSQI